RDIETGLKVQQGSWYHLGLKNISRSQLSYVNSRRDFKLFQSLYYLLWVMEAVVPALSRPTTA
ncbi:MAG: DUF4372 domain-containing protein, partial [Bacteroidales bacterium]|nr:DUF4372 domain-containing protein [Bacteroidales bacterium]